jgi:hypothetical protein
LDFKTGLDFYPALIFFRTSLSLTTSPIPIADFLGLPWLRSRKSGLIRRTEEDSAFIVQKVVERAGKAFALYR